MTQTHAKKFILFLLDAISEHSPALYRHAPIALAQRCFLHDQCCQRAVAAPLNQGNRHNAGS
ncbi:hypothetical protein ALQ32_102443 [Pseudomonas syringae pv. tagetis]|uniref:Uncharacterized protein n=1 Tax=Pseudomonas syringae pv. tagetis TaxID=129140 RepID=A0A3M3ZFZ8_9PSED|nr:hypothetical protein ALQ32_102443 [Pseudomonas syringae pv. tagetis]